MNDAPTHDVSMDRRTYQALDDARQHAIRALSAAKAAQPFDSEAMVALIRVAAQLGEASRVLDSLRNRARVSA